MMRKLVSMGNLSKLLCIQSCIELQQVINRIHVLQLILYFLGYVSIYVFILYIYIEDDFSRLEQRGNNNHAILHQRA